MKVLILKNMKLLLQTLNLLSKLVVIQLILIIPNF
jgi:hypothetical protein